MRRAPEVGETPAYGSIWSWTDEPGHVKMMAIGRAPDKDPAIWRWHFITLDEYARVEGDWHWLSRGGESILDDWVCWDEGRD